MLEYYQQQLQRKYQKNLNGISKGFRDDEIQGYIKKK